MNSLYNGITALQPVYQIFGLPVVLILKSLILMKLWSLCTVVYCVSVQRITM